MGAVFQDVLIRATVAAVFARLFNSVNRGFYTQQLHFMLTKFCPVIGHSSSGREWVCAHIFAFGFGLLGGTDFNHPGCQFRNGDCFVGVAGRGGSGYLVVTCLPPVLLGGLR